MYFKCHANRRGYRGGLRDSSDAPGGCAGGQGSVSVLSSFQCYRDGDCLPFSYAGFVVS